MLKHSQKNRLFNKSFQSGFTLIELSIVMVILALLIGAAASMFGPSSDKGKSSVLVSNIAEIVANASSFKTVGKTTFTGINIQWMVDRGLLPKPWGDGTTANPWGGSYTAAVNSTNASQLQVTATSVPNESCLAIADSISSSYVSAACSSGTVTVIAK